MPAAALPLSTCDDDVLRPLVGVLTDIDDTLTTDGAICAQALEALADLRRSGLPVVAITGRPLGWSRPFAAAWPIDAIVAENGAVAVFREGGDPAAGGPGGLVDPVAALRVEFQQDEATRRVNALRLQQAAARVLREVPGATLARDSAGRVTDIAIDHSEFSHLPPAAVAQVVSVMRDEGLRATVSSIHVNGWFGDHDKPSGARWIVQRLFGRRLDDEWARWAYVGDSTNDQAMFACCPVSVGVANLRRFADQLTVWPAWLTQAERGAGFAEFGRRVLAARGRACAVPCADPLAAPLAAPHAAPLAGQPRP